VKELENDMRTRNQWQCSSALASILSLAATSGYAGGLPSHGHFVSGRGSIEKGNQSLTVKQSSTTGIIDWNSFSVGKKSAVTFDNGAGATLSRVTGSNLSKIAGALHATGSLYLMNGAGVIISGAGKIVTGGDFAATTGSGSDAFQNERLKAHGNVVNRGTITAGGAVTLAGGNVRDSGGISAANVRLKGANRLFVGGDVRAQAADGAGGTIIAAGRHIDVASNARISASGTRGGTVLIGGDIHGGAVADDDLIGHKVRNAATTIIGKGARIEANSMQGAGGSIVIWSDGRTSFAGSISATGHDKGGFAEVSSHDLLGFDGSINLKAVSGGTGTLLLDPENVTIEAGTTANGGFSNSTFHPTGDDSILSVADLKAALANANVVVTTGGANSSGAQSGDITVASNVTWASGNKLTLSAYGAININASLSGADLKLAATTGNIMISKAISMTGSVTLDSGGVILESGKGAVDAQILNGSAAHGATLDGANKISQLGAFTTTGGFAAGFSLTDHETLTVTGVVNAHQGNLYLSTVGAGHDIEIENKIEAASSNEDEMADLQSAGTLSERGAGMIQAWTMIGTSVGGATLGGANLIKDLWHFTNEDSGGFALTNARSIGILGKIDAGEDDLTLTVTGSRTNVLNLFNGDFMSSGTSAFASSGDITQSAGSIETSTFSAKAAGSILLTGNNLVDNIEALSFSGEFSFNNAKTVTIGVPIDTGKANISLSTTGVHSKLILDGALTTGGTLFLSSEHKIEEDSNATISARSLSVDGNGDVDLNGANEISTLDYVTLGGGGSFSLSDDESLTVASGVNVFTDANITLTTVGAGHNITNGGLLWTSGAKSVVTLDSAGKILSHHGAFQTYALKGSSVGGATLAGSNSSANVLKGFVNTGSGNISISNIGTVTGMVSNTGGNIKIAGGLLIESPIEASGKVTLSGQNVREVNGGSIAASSLVVDALYDATLGSHANAFATLDASKGGELFALTDSEAMTVAGNITAGWETVSLTTLSGDLILDALIKSGTQSGAGVDLASAGTITEGDSGKINTVSLSVMAGGFVSLNDPANLITAVSGTANGTVSIIDKDSLTVGAIDAGSRNIAITTVASGKAMTLNGELDGGEIDLTSASTITETSIGEIHAAALTGSSSGAVQLNNADNQLAELEVFTTNGAGDFSITDDADLAVVGTVAVGSHGINLTTLSIGAITLDAALDAGTVSLDSAGAITENDAGAVVASTLAGYSVSAVDLSSNNNLVGSLGVFSTNNHGDFTLVDGQTLDVSGAVNAGSHNISLTTASGDIAIDGELEAGTVNLMSAGQANESSSGAIVASLLNVTAQTGISLTSSNNNITAIGTDATASGPSNITQ
jgi:filamentous hemagglutinin family protein